MPLRTEHEIHRRRASRNLGLLGVLILFVGLIFGLTIAKVKTGDNMAGFDHQVETAVAPGAAITAPLAPGTGPAPNTATTEAGQ